MQALASDHSSWLHKAVRLVSDLHNGVVPLDESINRTRLEALIPDLHDRTGRSTDQKEKMLLATLEMRARGVLERWMNDRTSTN